MNGYVDEEGKALVDVELMPHVVPPLTISVWIDTGFTGDLVLPSSLIADLALTRSGAVDAVLADGSLVPMSTYTCPIVWFGRTQHLEVVANEGEHALLGIGLLQGRELSVNYRTKRITLE
jgi:clan AA aspartic protease